MDKAKGTNWLIKLANYHIVLGKLEMSIKIFTAKVTTGKKEATFFTKLPWVEKQIKEKLGFTPYPGTLNLQLPKNTQMKDVLPLEKAIEIKPKKGFMPGKCFKAIVMGKVEGAIIIPDVPNYSANLLEFIAPVNLRKELNLKDNDTVVIMIP